MRITRLAAQARNPERVNVSVDGAYKFSLTVNQVLELGLRAGAEYDEDELAHIEEEGVFGKLYARAFEYVLVRPRSAREVRQYLTRRRAVKGKPVAPPSEANVERVFGLLSEKSYINDEKFARYWVQNRNVKKGSSAKKLRAELAQKGVASSIVDSILAEVGRDDIDEIQKVLERVRRRYTDEQKLIAYLARQGFSYGDIRQALDEEV